MLKKAILFLLISLLHFGAFAQTLQPSDTDSKITFVIKNMGLSVDGSFKELAGKMVFDPKNLSNSIFDVTVAANTINTGIAKRDEHLKKEEFFGAEKHPVISIKTTKIQAKKNNLYFTTAVLTIKGVSKNIQFDFIAKPITSGYHFTGGFTINRKDFGVGGNSMTMGDEVKVSLDVLGKK